MDKEQLIRIWEKFTEDNDFILNPEKEHVNKVAEGVLKLEKDTGLKYCPCRLRTGDFDKDIELVCPCNFKIQECWNKDNRCWCGLFVKKQ